MPPRTRSKASEYLLGTYTGSAKFKTWVKSLSVTADTLLWQRSEGNAIVIHMSVNSNRKFVEMKDIGDIVAWIYQCMGDRKLISSRMIYMR